MLHSGIVLLLCCTVVCCDGGCGTANSISANTYVPETEVVVEETVPYIPEPEVVVEETVPYIPETEIVLDETVMQPYEEYFKYYNVAGVEIRKDLQKYLYDRLEYFGIAWYYPYAVCQIFQESRWNPYSTNGEDHGLCQIKGIYWDKRCEASGIPGSDIWDPYSQLHVFAWLMKQYLDVSGNNTGKALSIYFLGYDGYSDLYVKHVMSWMYQLQEVFE